MFYTNGKLQYTEESEFSDTYLATGVDGDAPPERRWSDGRSLDGKSEFKLEQARPPGGEPVRSAPPVESHAQREQIAGNPGQSPNLATQRPQQHAGGTVDKLKEKVG